MLPIHFAPLQGYTDDAYRRAHHAVCGDGVATYYTPFVRVEKGTVRPKDTFDARPEYNPGIPLVIQAIAADATELRIILDAVRTLRRNAAEQGTAADTWADPGARVRIDINMGCPFPLQVRHGRGAGLLTNPYAVRDICAVVAHETGVDFSVKMRLGVDDAGQWRNILPILADTPLVSVTVHPRIATQQYRGEVDRTAFEQVMAACPHPIIYNGDVTTVAQLRDLETQYPTLGGVMIGRGQLARPTLAAEYHYGTALSDDQVAGYMRRIHDEVQVALARRIPGEAQLLMRLRTFWDFAEPTLGRKAYKRLHKAGSMRNYLAALPPICTPEGNKKWL